jgi:hypothetical protein
MKDHADQMNMTAKCWVGHSTNTTLKSQHYASTNLSLGSFLMKQGALQHYLSCKLPIDK